MTPNGGAQFAIVVDGKTLSWRDSPAIALGAAQYVKERQPYSEVTVRDLRDGSVRDLRDGSVKTVAGPKMGPL